MSRTERDALIARALLPWERQPVRPAALAPALSFHARLLLRQWSHLLGGASGADLRQRLRRDNLTPHSLRDPTSAEGSAAAISRAAKPWAQLLRGLLIRNNACNRGDWVARLVADTDARLTNQLARAGLDQLTPRARASLSSHLASRLTGLWPRDWPEDLPFASCLNRAPLAARFSAVTVVQWQQWAFELAGHVQRDRPALIDLFGLAPDATVETITPALSDPHDHGRSVCRLRFSDGRMLFLKPRPLDTEAAWGHLVAWHNDQLPHLVLRAPQTLSGKRHGWMAPADSPPADKPPADDLPNWFRRAGALVAIAHALGAKDLHRGNLIAATDQLVLVDAECIVPTRADEGTSDGLPLLRSGLLAEWWHEGEIAQDQGGLTGNTPAALADHLPAFLDGFGQTHSLWQQRAHWLANDRHSPLRAFDHCRLRHLHRPTQSYGMVMASATSPAMLADGRSFALRLEALARPTADRNLDQSTPPSRKAPARSPADWPLIRAEQRALSRLDVPAFSVCANDTSIRDHDGRNLSVQLDQSPISLLRHRLAWLGGPGGATDLDRQRALFTRLYGSPRTITISERPHGPATASQGLAQHLADQAILCPDGCPRWLTPVIEGGFGRIHTAHDHGLYNGSAGIAVFLASVTAVSTGGDSRPGDLALEALALKTLMALPEQQRAAAGAGTGLGRGLGGTLFALAEGGRLLNAPQLWQQALSLLPGLPVPGAPNLQSRHARSNDLLGGQAGLLVGLARLAATSGADSVQLTLRRHGLHLFEQLSTLSDNQLSDSLFGTGLTGMSHGASGIAVALMALGHQVPDLMDQAMALALKALVAEDRHWADPDGNWSDLRLRKDFQKDQPPAQGLSWCHGAPGMALARLAVWSALPPGCHERNLLEQHMIRALVTTRDAPDRGEDGLCCGNAGRIWTLAEAGQRLARPDFSDAAQALASSMLARLSAQGNFRLPPDRAGCPIPTSLFTGLAGIGMMFLKIAMPQTGDFACLPNPLLPDGWHTT